MKPLFQLQNDLKGHAGPIYDASIDSINNRVFSLSADKIISSWDLASGNNLPLNIKLVHSGYALCHTSDQQIWYASLLGNIHVIDLNQRAEIKNFAYHKSPVFRIIEIPESNIIASADANGYLGLWDKKDLKNLAFVPLGSEKIREINYNPHLKSLCLGNYSGELLDVDFETLNTRKIAINNPEASPIHSTSYLESKKIWLLGLKNGHLASSTENIKKGLHLPVHNFGIYGLLALDNEGILVSCSRDKTIKVWNLHDFTLIHELCFKEGGHNRSINGDE